MKAAFARFAGSKATFASLGAGLFALLAVAGCKPEHPKCRKDKHCNVEEGEKCVDKICQNCVTDEECVGKGENGENLSCVDFRCGGDAAGEGGGGVGEQGAPCASTLECGGGLVCKAGACDVCAEDLDCAEGTCDLDSGRCSGGFDDGGGACSIDDDCAIDEICDGGQCIFSGELGNPGEVLCELQAVFFAFDSPTLSPQTQEQLKGAAQCMAEQGRHVFLEAHADPRGTEEYNILLTDKRGQGVKKFLQDLGVPGDVMQVISKGSLESQGTEEQSFSQDRRVEFIWQ